MDSQTQKTSVVTKGQGGGGINQELVMSRYAHLVPFARPSEYCAHPGLHPVTQANRDWLVQSFTALWGGAAIIPV